MKKIARMIHIIFAVLLIVLSLSSCQAPRKPGTDMNTEDRNITEQEKTQQEKGITEVNQEIIKSEAAADSLVDLRGVDDATVVFWGDKALVGVVLAEETMAGELRNEIINRVRNSNPTISNVDITTERSLFIKLDDVQQSLIRGENINNISKNVEDILNRINNSK